MVPRRLDHGPNRYRVERPERGQYLADDGGRLPDSRTHCPTREAICETWANVEFVKRRVLMDRFINLSMIAEPYNWVTVFLIVLWGAMVAALILSPSETI